MRTITNLMIDEFNIKRIGFDFMAYSLQKGDIYTFHHLIVPNRKGGPYARWNGAILCRQTSHDYIHQIESVDYDIFNCITLQMINMNVKGYLDRDNLRQIDDLLCCFEKEHCGERTRKGKVLIKEEYTRRNKF